jgi:hypothetical protein
MTSHIYAQSGDYTVRLTVYDNLGRELKSHSEKPGETDKPARRRGVRH